ncbi:MAG: PVC-type heme-binding CxxCH protein [Verrucomicrobiota bacterium]
MKPEPLIALAFFFAATTVSLGVDKDALPDVEEGFEINFYVREPHIINPSSLCFDKLGRLYVGAGPQYRHPKEDSPTDYIKILIDEDRDGTAETVKTFAEGLNCVQSMAWKGDELWVANAPELTVLRDTDGDDVADEYQIVYTGLNNLRHSLHGLNWGPDGWLYMTLGNTWVKPNAPKPIRDLQGIASDDRTEYPLTKIYTRDSYPKSYHPLNKDEKEGGIFRCRPGGHELELFARGMRNPWDMCMDSGFNWLATDNDPGAPGERIFMPIRHGHYSMRHPWKFDWMGKHIAVAPASDLFPSVSGSGTGVAYYTSRHFPEPYRDRYLIADWTNNCLFLYTPKWEGALQVPAVVKRKMVDGGTTRGGDLGYQGGKGRALFRPTDIEIGPDGALYIAGWGSVYGTEYVPKDQWTPEENAKYQGRVFRLRHQESPLVARAQWDTVKRRKSIETWNFDQLMEDLGSDVHVWRVHAQDELVRRGEKVWMALVKMVMSGALTETQATWATWAIGHIEREADPGHARMFALARGEWVSPEGADPATKRYRLNVRIQAIRVLGENEVAAAAPLLVKLLADEEPRLRVAAMGALDRIGWGDHGKAILDAVAYETDRVAFYTSWQVMRRQLPKAERRELLTDERVGIRRMIALGLMEEGDRSLQQRAGEILGQALAEGGELKALTLSASERHFRESTRILFAAEERGEIRYTVDGTEPTVKSAVAGSELSISEDTTVNAAVFREGRRVTAVESLVVHKISDSEWRDRLFVRGIRGQGNANSYRAEPESLQRGTLVYGDRQFTFTELPEGLAGATHIRTHNNDKGGRDPDFLRFVINTRATLYLAYDDRFQAPDKLVAGMQKTDLSLRMSNGESFVLYRCEVAPGEVVLGGNKVGGSGGESMYQVFLSKAAITKTTVEAAKAALARADVKKGEEIFFGRGTCFACHQVGDRGVAIGPDLVGIGKQHDIDYVIRSTLEPDAYIVEGFQQTRLKMKDGRELFGMIGEETALAIKLALPNGEQLEVQTLGIEKRTDARNSGMPASFAHTLNPQDTADLATWIMGLE